MPTRIGVTLVQLRIALVHARMLVCEYSTVTHLQAARSVGQVQRLALARVPVGVGPPKQSRKHGGDGNPKEGA